jgi:hypothetical protein
MRAATPVLALALLCTALAGGTALAVHVPGDYPTIQAALDAGETQVVVEAGTYPESLLVTHEVELVRDAAGGGDPTALPQVAGMHISFDTETWPRRVYVRGFHFTGPVTEVDIPGYNETAFEACRFDAGYVKDGYGHGIADSLGIRFCHIEGGVDALSYTALINDNTVVGGGIRVYSSGGGGVIVRNNLISGAPEWGIEMRGCCVRHVASGNTIRDSQNGITSWEYGHYDHNLVEDCRGTAYYGPRSDIHDNVARRCGGHGIDAGGPGTTIERNTVDSVGLCGIHVLGFAESVRGNKVNRSADHGIWLEVAFGVAGNLVLNAGGDGIRSHDAVDSNVVGRCAGAGIVAASAQHNTSYLNGGAGFEIAVGEDGTASISHNIACWNMGPGLLWSGTGTPVLGCNDWFDNAGGAVSGTDVGVSDMSLDPLFCDLPADSVSLRADSPLLDAPACGLIGARGEGCEGGPTGTLLALFDATVEEAGVLLRWQFGAPASVRVVVVERAEAEIGPWARLDLAASQEGEIIEALDTSAEAGGTYWYRLSVTFADETQATFGPIAAEVPGRIVVSGVSRLSPNPSSGATRIEYTVARQEAVRLSVLDVAGREVEVLAQGSLAPGRYSVVWDARRQGSPLAAGLYFVRWESPGRVLTQRLVRLR